MNILIAGASGLIGQELIHGLSKEHHFTVLGRHKDQLRQVFSGQFVSVSWDELDNLDATEFDAVINLSGLNISASRWTPKIKEEIISSRVDTTKRLVSWIIKQNARPHFYCANAVGIYGMQDNDDSEVFSEDTVIDFSHPKDFLSEVGIRWQEALNEAEQAGLAVTTTRFGVVLKKGKGMLGKLYPSFICGLGSVIGNGKQYLSWVSSKDVVNAYRFLLSHPEITGAVNLTSPNPCMQKDFAKAYAKVLHRPLILMTPGFVIQLLFGEMGDCLINHGQHVVPKRLLDEGFTFQYPAIEEALAYELSVRD
ncbi:TIGR01777 family oxidoreductase [Legionella worsleiensis]|uniref:Nucleoside-diphosphate sugar epimerase n=1 Tax=Legionella worsleiensis TaxID=45076 RepID=A0A0W1ALD0_9GAMM|nr:TIGR01777 family oxidoreductase [Legionella worsleiensis]KTD81971.1 nucleoside-diphosphate sugar epimerase [Legionella worsleiensis]STY31352.1 nucleoside-diphosphate sugar epimerase [Legionella worsleiensis]